jgi:hypothetical protein
MFTIKYNGTGTLDDNLDARTPRPAQMHPGLCKAMKVGPPDNLFFGREIPTICVSTIRRSFKEFFLGLRNVLTEVTRR